MKGMNSKGIRSGQLACIIIVIISLLFILFYHFYNRSFAMEVEIAEVENTEEKLAAEDAEPVEGATVTIEDEATALAGQVSTEEVIKTAYDIPSSFVNPTTGQTVRYKGGKTLERTHKITHGQSGYINDIATPDQDGFMKLDDRYLIAVGSKFKTTPGQYIDLVLQNGVVIKCIMGDAKADIDTDATNTFTYKSRCCSEFIIDEKTIRKDIYRRGNASFKTPTWDSPVVKVIVYDQFHN
jgi:hypothetical protein